jgi:ABC-type multidrug transport system ATPase subunit
LTPSVHVRGLVKRYGTFEAVKSVDFDIHAGEIHELVQQLRREQRTILITTHYIEEAEKLCDRVAIIDEGRMTGKSLRE